MGVYHKPPSQPFQRKKKHHTEFKWYPHIVTATIVGGFFTVTGAGVRPYRTCRADPSGRLTYPQAVQRPSPPRESGVFSSPKRVHLLIFCALIFHFRSVCYVPLRCTSVLVLNCARLFFVAAIHGMFFECESCGRLSIFS